MVRTACSRTQSRSTIPWDPPRAASLNPWPELRSTTTQSPSTEHVLSWEIMGHTDGLPTLTGNGHTAQSSTHPWRASGRREARNTDPSSFLGDARLGFDAGPCAPCP